MNKSTFQTICREFQRNYVNIFRQMYPARNRTGFTERNLSVNFSKAYEKVCETAGQNSVTWYEFQFGEKNNEHYDAVIVNPVANEIIVVESKRFSELDKKLRSAAQDIERIKNFPFTETERILNVENYIAYGVLLADIWTTETTSKRRKKEIVEQYRSGTFLSEHREIFSKVPANEEIIYDVQDFSRFRNNILSEMICSEYYLLSMCWKIKF